MNAPSSFPCVFWTVLPLAWAMLMLSCKIFIRMLERKVPEVWENLGKPRFGAFWGNGSKDFAEYLHGRKYRPLDNSRLVLAGNFNLVAWFFFGIAFASVISFYLLKPLFHVLNHR